MARSIIQCARCGKDCLKENKHIVNANKRNVIVLISSAQLAKNCFAHAVRFITDLYQHLRKVSGHFAGRVVEQSIIINLGLEQATPTTMELIALIEERH
jgi:hypothetical protein